MTDQTTEPQPHTPRLTVEIMRAKPLATGITAVEYMLTLTVPYVEQTYSQLGEAIIGPQGCFLVDRHQIHVVINRDDLSEAVFKAELKRRREVARASATPGADQ